MKKLIAGFFCLCLFTVFAVVIISTPSNILYFLNWGEYIDMELVRAFEEEHHCQVILEPVTSSEAMYQKISAGTTSYDVVVPGDYTVHQLYDEGKLRELDVNNPNYPYLGQYKTMYADKLSDLINKYMVNDEGRVFNSYFAPYFYGTYCMIYRTDKPEVAKAVEENGMKALYDNSLYTSTPRKGMYDTARWIVASDLLANEMDPNSCDLKGNTTANDMDTALKNKIIADVKAASFAEFGNDQLKRNVANGSLDMCFTQLGDFFDTLYLVYDEGEGDSIAFNVNVPKTTAAFFDSMVIPTTCQNYELANAFINFMMTPENAYQNACAIGYSPTLKSVKEAYEKDAEEGAYYYGEEGEENSLSMKDFLERYPVYLDPLGQVENPYILQPKSNQYLTTCESIFNALA